MYAHTRWVAVLLLAAVVVTVGLGVRAAEDFSLLPATPDVKPQPARAAATADNLDLKASGIYRGDAFQAVTDTDLRGLLGLPGVRPLDWRLNEELRQVKETPTAFVVAFRSPVGVGAIQFAGTPTVVKLLKDGASPDPAKADAWQALEIDKRQSGAFTVALPAGTTTGAVMFLDESGSDHARLGLAKIFAQRLHNVTPDALAYAESEYVAYSPFGPPFTHRAAIVTSGDWGHWQNTGLDPRGRMPRAPVSDINPSWFMLTWKQPQIISSFWLGDNFEQLTVQYYSGPESINPRAGTDREWRLIRQEITPAAGGHFVTLAQPITTRGLRINILKTSHGPIARLNGAHVFVDLGKDPTPPAAAAASANEPPPVRAAYAYDFDGTVTAVINDAQGRRVRNLFAREALTAGPHELAWDLKDEAGNTVPLGTYEWKTLAGPVLGLRYEMTVYPNVSENSPDNPPWHTSMSGPGGWLADHSPNRSGAASGDFVFFGAPVAESGVSMAVCDLTGKKLWAVPSFAGFTGAYVLAADSKTVFVLADAENVAEQYRIDATSELLWAVDIASREVRDLARLEPSNTRKRGATGMAAADNKLFIAVGAEDDWLATSASPSDVDIEKCFPRYAAQRKPRYPMEIVPNPRNDFMRLFRLTDKPPGAEGLSILETTPGKSGRRHLMLAFDKPVPIGSVILPVAMDPGVKVTLSVPKADAPYPPNPGDSRLWVPFEVQPEKPWDVAVAPKDCVARALRVTFTRGDDDLFTDSEESAADEYSTDFSGSSEDGLEFTTDKPSVDLAGDIWAGKLEGLKIVGRRFENVARSAKITVNSGQIGPDGVWDAQRTNPVTRRDPGIYCMTWDQPQTLRGLAIKELDGLRAEIDVFTGEGDPDLAADNGWQHVRSYTQPLRSLYMGRANPNARYVDGYVDFGAEIATRAVRIRVVAPILNLDGEAALRWDIERGKVDPTRCRLFGVAAMKYLGGEASAAADPLTYHRIEMIDGESGKVEKEFPLHQPGPIAIKGGELFVTSGRDLVKINPADGAVTTLVAGDLVKPQAMAIDKAGLVYVYDVALDRRNIRVYDVAKKQMVRTIGTPGGYVAGAWDPTRLHDISALVIDAKDQLWAVDQTYFPKRVSLWTTDGQWQKDFLGNTCYGGAGILDRHDKSRLYYGPLEFAIDWKTGRSTLKNFTWMGPTPAGDVPVEVNGRRYMTTRWEGGRAWQGVGIVYLHEKDQLKLAAAVGRAESFAPLADPDLQGELMPKLAGKTMADVNVIWSDLNGDGLVQADEVTFIPRQPNDREIGVTGFNNDLGVQQGVIRYSVTKFLPSGVPVYEAKTFPDIQGLTLYRMDDGNFHTLGSKSVEALMTPEGQTLWTYPAEGWTTHGYAEAGPYSPGQIVAQFFMAGHDKAHAGDLGEFFVINTNMGSWNLWTADGMLASWIFNDQRNPGLRNWNMPEHDRGMKMDDVTIGQEHFNAYFCRTADNRYYAVAGHNHVSVVEVLGMDKFKRLAGTIEVTPEAVNKTAAWEASRQKEQLYDRTPVIECFKVRQAPRLDGDGSDFVSPAVEFGARRDGQLSRGASVRIAWDDTNLYLYFQVAGLGPMRNSGEQMDRLFKTGAAVDLHIGVDAAADPARATPVAGDKRLLMTFLNNGRKPVAVLYDAVVPGTPADAAWKAVSPISSVSFDRVRVLETAKLVLRDGGDRYTVGASIPLSELGLKPAENMRLKLDWGAILTDSNGNSVMRRSYWANQATSIIADVPSEARLHPDLWGWALFHESARRDAATMSDMIGDDGKLNAPGAVDDPLLKDFRDELREK
ncbi:MAG: hypothetical protein FWE88_06015 [Phycisphaerae bacterium]|nr:hypothetical protein [Phycisphaerae bacterium]